MQPHPLPPEQRIQGAPLLDFDDLFGYAPCLRGVVAGMPLSSDHTRQRAKFLGLREWLMLSSAFDLPCYAQPVDGDTARLWLRIGTRWIGEAQVDQEPLPLSAEEPLQLRRHEPLLDPVLRHHVNLALLRIEAQFQHWASHHPDAVVALLHRPGLPAEDITEALVRLPVEMRARTVATNVWMEPCGRTRQGKVLLYRPSEALVSYRHAQAQAECLQCNTTSAPREDVRRL